MEQHYRHPARGPRELSAQKGKRAGGGSGSAHPRNGHAVRTGRETRPSSQKAQTTSNGVPAGEDKGHREGATRYTHRGEREGGGRRTSTDTGRALLTCCVFSPVAGFAIVKPHKILNAHVVTSITSSFAALETRKRH